MIELRKFTAADADAVRQRLYPDLVPGQITEMIGQWNAGTFDGKFFRMFAVLSDGEIAGTVSLLQQEESCVSFGIEITEGCRRRGIAAEAGAQVLRYAAQRGYRKVISQVRQDNAASIALHRKLGFVLTEKTVNRKGNPVFLYEKDL